ncbi:hypothetical protein OHS70_16845 [Streptomyces sp. NBC_00390]|uniref:hypothetical protein n=1 Tax=Streptomyces sp. NBC_00390 TaxID=2975736 RepID=UPI002E1BC30C
MNAVLRFLLNAVIIDEPGTKGRYFGFGRVDIIEARCLKRGLLHISDERQVSMTFLDEGRVW